MDQYFLLTNMPVPKQASFVSTFYSGTKFCCGTVPARKLGIQLRRSHGASFGAFMREYFAFPNEDRRLQDEWANLKQYETIFEYVSVLTALAMRIPGLAQTQILDKFIRGLKPKTRIEVELRDSKTPNEAYRLTNRFDRIVYDARNTSFLTQNYNHYTPISGASSMRITANLCKSIPYDLVDPDRKTFSDPKVFSNLAIRDSTLRAESQGTSRRIAPTDKGNLGKRINREKGDVSRGRQLY